MCHQTVRQDPSAQSRASGRPAAGPAQGEAGPDHLEDEGDQNQDGDVLGRTDSDSAAAGDQVEQAEVDGLGCGDGGGKPEQPAGPNEGVHGLCFSPTGDFVGFSGPVPGRSSGDFIHSHALRRSPSLPDTSTRSEESPEAAPCLAPASAVNGNAFEGQPDDLRAESEAAACPDNDDRHERTNGLNSAHPSGRENDKVSEIRSPPESSELLMRVDEAQSCVENGALSHSPHEPPACPR